MTDGNVFAEEKENLKRTAQISLFGKKITVKNYLCAKNGCPYKQKPEPLELQLSIVPTFYCGAHCSFCSAAASAGNRSFLDIKKLEKVLRELDSKKVIRGISITGGEPFTDITLLNEIIEMIFDICGVEKEISINTNGSGLSRLKEIQRLPYVDTIHISRHHYDDEKNRAYFGIPVATGEEIAKITDIVKDPKLFVFNCLLLKGGIDSKEECIRFLEFAGKTGVPKVGFITPMVVNGYTEKNRISYTKVFDRNEPRTLFTTGYRDFESCRCQDGVYLTDSGKLVEFYGRETEYGCTGYVRGLVYGADNVLRTGFSPDAEVIFEQG